MQATRARALVIGPAANGIPTPLCKCGCGQQVAIDSQGKFRKFTKGHLAPYLERISIENFWAHVEIGAQDECWPWTGHIDDRKGYGNASWHGRTRRAHKVAYLIAVGPVPDGRVLDHMCHVRGNGCPGGRWCLHRRCCNPAHLKPVSSAENIKRGMATCVLNALKTECVHGHPFTEENTIIRKDGKRACRECKRRDHKKLTQKRRAARLAALEASALWSL